MPSLQINYMAPEAIAPMQHEDCDGDAATSERLKMRLGRASDIWSLGCILYQMIYGRPPFAALNTIQKLSVIPNPKHVIKYPEGGDIDAVESMKCCLLHDARSRSKIRGPDGLLEKRYLKVSSGSITVPAAASTAVSTAVSTAPAASSTPPAASVDSLVTQVLPMGKV
jgi:serine/threonine-protein kinase TTK/MPS1